MKIAFFDRVRGVSVGLNGVVLATNDGGLTWVPPAGLKYYNWFSGVSLTEDGHGLIVGSGGKIARTEDGGKKWQ